MSHCWGSSACAISQECYGSERRSYRGSYFCLPSSLRPKGRRKAPPETSHPPNTPPSFSVSPLPADRHVVHTTLVSGLDSRRAIRGERGKTWQASGTRPFLPEVKWL